MKESYSNAELLEGIRRKDHSSLSFVYQEYYAPVERLICTNSGTAEDARDVFQEALVVVYEQLTEESGKSISNLRAYLYGVSKNLWLMKLRKSGRQGMMTMNTEDLNDIADDPQEACIQHERYELMRKHFLRLGDDCRQVLSLFFKGMSLREIGEMMGLTEKYAKKKKFTCQKKLIMSVEADESYRELIF